MRSAAAAAGLVLLIAVACDRRGGEAALFTLRDSAGVAIVENEGAQWSENEAWVVAGSPHLEIGSTERPGQDLYEGTGAVRMSDGRVAVANSGSSEIRIFSDTGELITAIGGPGDGPGEFRSLNHIFLLPGDSILASDFALDRLSVFSPHGDLVRTAQLAPAPSGGIPAPSARLGDGSLLARPGFSFGGGAPTGVHQDTMTLLHYGADGSYLGELGRVPGSEFFVFSEGGNTLGGERIWGTKTHLAAAGNDFIVGRSADYSYEVHGPDGALLRIVRARRPARSVTDADVAKLREPDPDAAPGSEALWARVLAAIEYPTHFPAYAGITVDADGHVWIREYVWPEDAAVPQQWQVFDAEGRWLGGVSMPAGFTALHIGADEVLGIYRDDMDVEHLQAYRLTRTAR